MKLSELVARLNSFDSTQCPNDAMPPTNICKNEQLRMNLLANFLRMHAQDKSLKNLDLTWQNFTAYCTMYIGFINDRNSFSPFIDKTIVDIFPKQNTHPGVTVHQAEPEWDRFFPLDLTYLEAAKNHHTWLQYAASLVSASSAVSSSSTSSDSASTQVLPLPVLKSQESSYDNNEQEISSLSSSRNSRSAARKMSATINNAPDSHTRAVIRHSTARLQIQQLQLQQLQQQPIQKPCVSLWLQDHNHYRFPGTAQNTSSDNASHTTNATSETPELVTRFQPRRPL